MPIIETGLGLAKAIAPSATKAAGSALSKAALSWLSNQFLAREEKKKKVANEDKVWNDVAINVVKQTKDLADRFSKITTVAFPNHPVPLESIYVPLTLKATGADETCVASGFPAELFAKHKKLILVDVAGMGKSTLSKMLYITAIEQKAYLPILIDLRRLTANSKIEQTLSEQFGVKPAHQEVFTELLLTKPILYIFDGFDEVADGEKNEVARTVRNFVDRAPAANFMITSRPELFFSDYTDFHHLHIQPLNKDEAFELIRRYGAAFEIEDRAKSLLEELKAKHDDSVHSFLQNPLLTSLLFRAYDYKSVIPVKRSLFYRQVFDALYESHDLNKETAYTRGKRTGLHHDEFHAALRAIASQFRLRKVVEVVVSDFLAMARDVSKSQCPDLSFSADDFLHDVTHAVPLFTRDGNLVKWSHKSLLDYFLAEFLLRDYSKPKSDALHRLAFGADPYTNENLLALVQESDPILFAQSITIPATSELLKRNQRILEALPKDIDPEIAKDIADFGTFFEVVLSPDTDRHPAELWATYVSEVQTNALVAADQFFPRVIYHYGEKAGNIGVFVNLYAAALTVPIKLGGFSSQNIYQIARKYPREEAFARFRGSATTRSMFASRFETGDFSTIDEEFEAVMGIIGRSDLQFSSRDNLYKAKSSLERAVEATTKARSDDIF